MKIIFNVIILLFFFSEMLHAQQGYRFGTYGVDDGLSQSNIHTLANDALGYLWVGTGKGLNRFNGQTFKTYLPSKDSLQNGIVNQDVTDIVEDSNGMLWIATVNGLSKFDPMLEKFTNFREGEGCENCSRYMSITKLLEDGEYIWLGTSGGLGRIHKTENTLEFWPYEEGKEKGPKKTAIRELLKLDENSLLIASNEGISIMNITNQTFTHLDSSDGLLENKVQSLYRDSKNRFWIGYENHGFSKLIGDWGNPSFKHYPSGNNGPSHNFIYAFEEDQDGNLWIATFNGLNIFNPEDESFTYIFQSKETQNSLASNQITSLYKDTAHRMWVGTQLGLNVYDPYINQFEYLVSDKNSPNSLAANETFSIFEDSQGALWIGNYANGLTVILDHAGKKEYHHISEGKGPQKLSGAQVLDFEEDVQGRIWAATFNGINIIDWPDRNSKEYRITQLPLSSVVHNPHLTQYTYCVKRGPDGKMWIGTHGAGVIAVDANMNLKQYVNKENPDRVASNIVLNISFDSKERVWLPHSNNGFSIIENIEEQNHFKSGSHLKGIELNSIHQIVFDGNGVLMSTDMGLLHFENKEELLTSPTPKFTLYNEEKNLSDDVVYAIEKAGNKEFWVSTGNGLSIVGIQKKTVFPIKEALGTINKEFNHNASTFTRDGTLYFGGIGGVVAIRPDRFNRNKIAPKVYLSDPRILNEPIPISSEETKKTTLPKDIRYLEKLTLKPADKILSFAVQPVNFTLADKTLYSYKLQGLDESWTTTSNPIITRSNLDPGTYTLSVKAQNNDGLWSNPISMEIEMLPPWHRTWWAYLLFAIGIVGIFYLLLKLRLQQERKVELARAQERDIFRKRSSRDFHDEAGTRITRIALITELAKLNSKDNAEMQGFLTQIDENLQDLNNGMRDFIWTLDPTKDNAFDTLTRFTEFAGNFCEIAGILFKSEHISEDLKNKELNMAERRHLLLILKEALNNSVKHGNPTEINFNIISKPGKLTVHLKDNGSGFKTDDNSGGYGLQNMRERSEALGGALKIKSAANGGTRLTLTLETTRLGN